MSAAGGTLLAGVVMGISLLVIAPAGATLATGSDAAEARPRVFTDGRLRPGHLETIRVAGFPGRGVTEVSFFPTAICEDECGVRTYRGGRTDANGDTKFRVRVPGTFFDHRNRHVYFRDGERIDVNVTWSGQGHGFAAASATPQPILVRVHGADRG